jgi:hypothetical protein
MKDPQATILNVHVKDPQDLQRVVAQLKLATERADKHGVVTVNVISQEASKPAKTTPQDNQAASGAPETGKQPAEAPETTTKAQDKALTKAERKALAKAAGK